MYIDVISTSLKAGDLCLVFSLFIKILERCNWLSFLYIGADVTEIFQTLPVTAVVS